MYAIKRELKVNDKEATYLAESARHSRFFYNRALGISRSHGGFDGVKAGGTIGNLQLDGFQIPEGGYRTIGSCKDKSEIWAANLGSILYLKTKA